MKDKKQFMIRSLYCAVLAVVLVLCMMPAMAFADDGAEPVTVKMTISDEGKLAEANDGSLMAAREVTVVDVDKDGKLTYDEALKAAHEAYFNADAYDPGSGMVRKLWAKSGGNFLFFINHKGIATNVLEETVADGDDLTAAILVDSNYYSDWYAYFTADKTEINAGETVELTLQGHLGMAYTDEDKKDVPLAGFAVKTADGKELGTTDENGKVTVKADDPGLLVVTAEGAVKGAVVSTFGMPMGKTEDGKYLAGGFTADYSSMVYLYTEEDYGIGPYPADEIKEMDMYDYMDLEEEELEAYHWVYANNYVSQSECYYPVKVSAPIIAPAAVIVAVPEPVEAKVTISDKGALKVVDEPVTVSDLDGDYAITINDALIAGHVAFAPNGADDYGYGNTDWGLSITKLWGDESGNFGYYVNNKMAWGPTDPIAEGDSVNAYVTKNAYPNDERFSYFDKNAGEAVVGEAFDVVLNYRESFDDSWQPVFKPLAGASVGYYDGETFVPLAVTDETGKASVVFKKAGDCVLTAIGPESAAIVPPFCKAAVAKGAQPMTVKPKTAKVKYAKLKKKAQKLAVGKVLTVKKQEGTVTYVKKSGNKKITIAKKTGRVTVKKGLKKGTYKVKVAVTAAGSEGFEAGTQTVTFKIKVS